LDPKEGQHYSIEDAEAGIRDLPDTYWVRLRLWAAWKLSGNCISEADDVIADVWERFIRGTRRWPVGTKIEACFWNAVKSAIDGEWDKHDRQVANRHAPITPDGEPDDPFENVVDKITGQSMTELMVKGPLNELMAAAERRRQEQIVEHIENSFADDGAVTAVLISLEQGLNAQKIQEAFSLTETQYDSARKKLRRFLNRHYPNQWRSHEQRQQEPESLA